MNINFGCTNVRKIDNVCKWVKSKLSNPKDFTKGNLRDYVLEVIIESMSEDTMIKCLLSQMTKE